MNEELHWYALSFSYSTGLSVGYACTYMGWPDQLLSIPRINDAKKDALSQVKSSASGVLVGAVYLDYMTKQQVTTHV